MRGRGLGASGFSVSDSENSAEVSSQNLMYGKFPQMQEESYEIL